MREQRGKKASEKERRGTREFLSFLFKARTQSEHFKEFIMALLGTAGTFSFSTLTLPSPNSVAKRTGISGGTANIRGLKSKDVSFRGLQIKSNAQVPSKINGIPVATSARDGFVSSENFSIRSYETDADGTASIETLMNYFQEGGVNHFNITGLRRDDFASTPEMCKRNLIWASTQMRVIAHRYPRWGDVVQLDTWISESGKNAVRLDCLLRDFKTGEILTRASRVCVMMNKLTRRLYKFPEEARREIGSYFVNSTQILEEDNRKLPKLDDKTADYICTSLRPRWSDLDINQHVNNVKYIGWILESVPQSILERHELSAMTLEFRRECGRDSKLQSLTGVSGADVGHSGHVECNHLLQLEDGAEIARGRTEWRLKLG